MKKNKLVSMVLLSLLVIGLVSAGIVEYFGQRTTTIDVELPIDVVGDNINELNGIGGNTVKGSELEIVNKIDSKIDVKITSTKITGVETSYVSTLNLAQKIVDFGADKWDLLNGGKIAEVEYTLVGKDFNAEVISGNINGYELIYYKDNSDRYNNPAIAIAIADINDNLPYAEDGNTADINYCTTEEYKTCNGAKIWYVPSNAVTDGEIDWNRASEFLFETSLIQYNVDGVITTYPEADLIFKPLFDLALNLEGEIVITTSVSLNEE